VHCFAKIDQYWWLRSGFVLMVVLKAEKVRLVFTVLKWMVCHYFSF